MRRAAALVWLTACAFHGDATGTFDAPAPVVDAPTGPVEITLSETTDATIATNASFACNQTSPQYTRMNSYFRVFHLPDFGITTPLHLSKVSFGVQQAMAGGGAPDQPLQVNLGTYAGTEGATTLTGITTPIDASSDLRVANGALTMVDVPFTDTIAPDQSLIVEIAIPDGVAAQNVFFIGTNSHGESRPSYILAASCSLATPTSMSAIADAQSPPLTHSNLVLTVTGTHGS